MLHLVLLPVIPLHLMLFQLTPRLHIRIVVTLATHTLHHHYIIDKLVPIRAYHTL